MNPVLPFDEEDSTALAEAVWDEMGAEALTNAAARAFRLTQGHPFYLDVACREAAVVARQLEREVTPSMVDAAFALSIHRPEDQINIACAEMYQALTDRHRSPVVRGFLDALAIGEPTNVPEIAQRMGGVAAATV